MAIMKVAKVGGNVITDTDKNLAFTSELPCLVENISGTIDITTDVSGVGSGDVTHGLGYVPNYYAFVRDPYSTGDWYPHQSGTLGTITYVDTTKIYFSIEKDPSTTYRIYYQIFGNRMDGAVGSGNTNIFGKLRVAKSGYDARDENDARNMTFFSGNSVHKISESLSGSDSISVTPPDIVELTIPHNLGYVPISFVMLDNTTFGQMLPNSILFDATYDYYINSTNLVIVIQDVSADPTYTDTFKYKILMDKIA